MAQTINVTATRNGIDTLINNSYVCPESVVVFTCEVRGQQIIAWSSDKYIGPSGRRLEFAASINSVGDYHESSTYNETVANVTINNAELLASTLNITVRLNRTDPQASVTCMDDNENGVSFVFTVLVDPEEPMSMSAVQTEHTINNDFGCIINAFWQRPSNLMNSEIRSYNVYADKTNMTDNAIISGISDIDTNIATLLVRNCDTQEVNVEAVNICGRAGPRNSTKIITPNKNLPTCDPSNKVDAGPLLGT